MMRDIDFHLKYCILGGFKIEEFRKECSSALILSVRSNPDLRKYHTNGIPLPSNAADMV